MISDRNKTRNIRDVAERLQRRYGKAAAREAHIRAIELEIAGYDEVAKFWLEVWFYLDDLTPQDSN